MPWVALYATAKIGVVSKTFNMGLYTGCKICNYPIMESPIARYRAENSVTLEAMGDSLDVDKSTVLRWEKGRVPIPLNKLAKIASITGIPREELRPDVFGEAVQ